MQRIYLMTNNIVWHEHLVSTSEREKHYNQKSCVLWYTGLSGSGKSTIANAVDRRLFDLGHHTFVLDGDNVRYGLNKDLGFDANSRVENIRRIGEVAKLFADAGLIVSAAFISPYQNDRDIIRAMLDARLIEVFVDTSLDLCEERDPKGLYKQARAGVIPNFTGISAPYELPQNPDIHLKTAVMSVADCANAIIEYLQNQQIIGSDK